MEWHVKEPGFQATLQDIFKYSKEPPLNGKTHKSLIYYLLLTWSHAVEETCINWTIRLPGDLGSWTVTPRAQRFGTNGAFMMKLPCYWDEFSLLPSRVSQAQLDYYIVRHRLS